MTFSVKPIGVIRSEIKNKEEAPLFYTEGAPSAVLEMIPEYLAGLDRLLSMKGRCFGASGNRGAEKTK